MSDFKKQFLFNKLEELQQQKENYYNQIQSINGLVKESETLLKRDLTDSEKTKLKNTGINFILQEFKANYPFKDATDEFNENALGVNTSVLKSKEALCKSYLSSVDCELKNGLFIASEKHLKVLEESCKVYTENEKQNKALEIAKQMEVLLSECENYGLITHLNRPLMNKVLRFLSVQVDKESNAYKIKTDYRGILLFS